VIVGWALKKKLKRIFEQQGGLMKAVEHSSSPQSHGGLEWLHSPTVCRCHLGPSVKRRKNRTVHSKMPYESHRLTATTKFAVVLQSSVHTSICDATLPHPEASPHTLPLPQGSVKWYDKTLEESAEKRIQTGHKLMTWTLKEQQLQWQCGPKAPRGRCGAGVSSNVKK